jgi:hypothetical protein
MRTRNHHLAGLAALALALPGLALADVTGAPETPVPTQAEKPVKALPEPARVISPDNPGGWADPPGETAIEDWGRQTPWGYGTDAVFPLTRNVYEADIPLWAKIPAYPFTGAFDVIWLPLGALGGLWGS